MVQSGSRESEKDVVAAAGVEDEFEKREVAEEMAVSGSGTRRARLYVMISRASSRLPAVRGRTRFFLELHRWLGLESRHVFVDSVLFDPGTLNQDLVLVPAESTANVLERLRSPANG